MYTVLGRPNCSWCSKAKELLSSKGKDVLYVDVSKDIWVRTLLVKARLTTVPQVFGPDGAYIGGHENLVNHLEEEHGTAAT